MKLITCSSFKGGAGKTTALMGLCSAFFAKGRTVALFEADENRPLGVWRQNAIARECWEENCEVFEAQELAELEDVYARAERQGFDYALADTHGGASELNNTLVASSDFLLLPCMLTPLDVDETLATYRYLLELFLVEEINIPTAVLKQRVPVGRKTMTQEHSSELLDQLPVFPKPMHERDIFASLKQRGMLHKMLGLIEHTPSMRVQLRNHLKAMDELLELSDFVEAQMGV